MANFTNPFENSTDILGDIKKAQNELLQKKKTLDNVTVGVSPDCDFSTIQEAIDVVKEGCVITIKAGTYTECLHVNKIISLVGEKAGTVIISQPKDTVCTVSKEAFFANIIFKNSKENTTELESINDIPHCALVKCEASSRFDNCTFQNSYTNGLIFEKAIQVAVCNCDFHDINNYGIYVLNGASLSIKDSKISKTDYDCLFISDGSYAYITNSKFYDSKSGGVTCNSAGKVIIDSCKIWNTKKAGLECRGNGTELTATNCEISETGDNGLVVNNKSAVYIINSKIHDINGRGIQCLSSSKITADSCEIWHTEDFAIKCQNENSQMTITNCRIHECPTGIICISSNVTVESCKIWNIDYCGITSNSSELTAKKCNIHDIKGRCGILCEDSSTVNVTECTFTSMSIGIEIEKKCKYHLSNNTFTKDVKTKINYVFFNDIVEYFLIGETFFGSWCGIFLEFCYICLVIEKKIKFSIIVFIGIILGGIVFGLIEICNLLLADKIQKGSKTIKEDGFIQWFLGLIIHIVIWGLMGLLMIFLFPNTTVLGDLVDNIIFLGDLGDNIILGIICCFWGILGPIFYICIF